MKRVYQKKMGANRYRWLPTYCECVFHRWNGRTLFSRKSYL